MVMSDMSSLFGMMIPNDLVELTGQVALGFMINI